jgi:hypothetical protein
MGHADHAELTVAQQRLHQLGWIEADSSGDVQKFQHVEATIAAFVFRNVRWWLPEPLGHKHLRQAGLPALGDEQRAQLSMPFRVDRLGQLGSRNRGLPESKLSSPILPK